MGSRRKLSWMPISFDLAEGSWNFAVRLGFKSLLGKIIEFRRRFMLFILITRAYERWIPSAGIRMGFSNSTNLPLYQEAQFTIDGVWLCLCLFATWNIAIPHCKGGVGGNPHGESFFIMVSLVLKNTANSEVRRLWSELIVLRLICFSCQDIPRTYLNK